MRDFQKEADELMAKGYRRTSSRYRIVSRVDRIAWKIWMAKEHSPWSMRQGLRWVIGMGVGSSADHYRRCYSKDQIEGVHQDVFKLIGGSGWDECGYCVGGVNKSTLWDVLVWYFYRARWIIL